jgi:hypothetical protein
MSDPVEPFRWHRCATIDDMQDFYLSRLPSIRIAARECGYAIGLHGSARRDFDLIAVPWVEVFKSKDDLARAIHGAACGLGRETYVWERKPHGRMAVSFPICWTEWHDMISAGHIDLSVMEVRDSSDLLLAASQGNISPARRDE